MRKYLAAATVGILAAAVGVALVSSQAERASGSAAAVTSVFKVEGMTCGGCEAGVRLQIKKLDGVEKVEASFDRGRAEVTYDPEKVTPEEIVTAIARLGYKTTSTGPGDPPTTNQLNDLVRAACLNPQVIPAP